MIPEIPLENQIFREPPIQLNNGNVIHVLKILPSRYAPHQHTDNKCYKRRKGGNDSMSIEEIKLQVIESCKKSAIFGFTVK